MKPMTIMALVMVLLAPASRANAATTDALGQQLHEAKCTACHAQRFGGDGSSVYLRPDRLIHDRNALRQRVAFCSAQTNAGLLPEEEQHVSDYLVQRYYKFK